MKKKYTTDILVATGEPILVENVTDGVSIVRLRGLDMEFMKHVAASLNATDGIESKELQGHGLALHDFRTRQETKIACGKYVKERVLASEFEGRQMNAAQIDMACVQTPEPKAVDDEADNS